MLAPRNIEYRLHNGMILQYHHEPSDFMYWILELQTEDDLFEFAVQDDTIRITHSRLRRIGWQLRLASKADIGHQLEYVPVSHYDCIANPQKSGGWPRWS